MSKILSAGAKNGLKVLNLVAFLFVGGCGSADCPEPGSVDPSTPLYHLSAGELFAGLAECPLAIAAEAGNTAEIERLVRDEGLDVNAIGVQGAPILFTALSNHRAFEKLLELGADPNLRFGGTDNVTVMHVACEYRLTKILDLALRYGGDPNTPAGLKGQSPIYRLMTFDAMSADIAIMEMLAEAGADLNFETSYKIVGSEVEGITPLVAAAYVARFDLVHWLLERGVPHSGFPRKGGKTLDQLIASSVALNLSQRQKDYRAAVAAKLVSADN
ncbi:MAG: hypothetical protein AAFM91_15155 [Pseudomonadota bacterium]